MTSKLDGEPTIENGSSTLNHNDNRSIDAPQDMSAEDKQEIAKLMKENPVISDEADDEDSKESSTDGQTDKNDRDLNPEPFEQDSIISDYPMDTLYNKKRVPYIEKNNGTIMLIKNGDHAKAIEHYNKALFSIKLLLEDQNLNVGEKYVVKVIEEVEIPISSNLTLCYLKTCDFQSVIKYADKLLESNPENSKILYRRGVAYTNLMEFEKARDDLVRANKLSPSDKKIKEAFDNYKKKKYEYKYKTQKICKKIFDSQSERLYPEEAKEEEKDENGIEKGSVPYYLGKSLEIGFAIPLVMYRMILQKPVNKAIGIGASLISLPDRLPIVGGLCKRGRTGTARIMRNQFSKFLDKKEAKEEIKMQKDTKDKVE